MSSTVENFWGTDFVSVGDTPPVALLKEQAKKLTEITQGQVQGWVKEWVDQGALYTSLYVRTPAMGDYRFKILELSHPVFDDPAKPFPVMVEDSFSPGGRRTINDMSEFERHLKSVLSSEPVRNVIVNMLRFSKQAVGSVDSA